LCIHLILPRPRRHPRALSEIIMEAAAASQDPSKINLQQGVLITW
jgi:hypothetical protein